jgi:hypothetical protein
MFDQNFWCFFTTGRRLPRSGRRPSRKTKMASQGDDMCGEAELSPEGEAIAAYGTATMVAFRVLVSCLQRNGALEPGEFAEALRLFTESAESEVDSMPLSILQNLRMVMLD